MSNTFYQDELNYLREVGPEFARTHPDLARTLGDRGADPDVERILEGVAFLCGRIRQKLDDELPELTAAVMSLLWPHYLRPIPSMTIMEFQPDLEAMQAANTVPAGAEFASVPVDGTRCRYRSTWPTVLRPWVLNEVRLETASAHPVRLSLSFLVSSKAKIANLDLRRVRLFLAGDVQTAFVLYLLLCGHVQEVRVSDGSGPTRSRVLGPGAIVPAGLDRDEAVLPYPAHSFAGYRLLQEYLTARQRFLFVDLVGLDRACTELELSERVQVDVTFNRRLDSFPLVSREHVRLHCVPAVNLFEHPAEPLRIRHDRSEYLVLPDKSGAADRRHFEIHSIARVCGLTRTDGGAAREYPPFYSFDHGTSRGRGGEDLGPYYHCRTVPNVVTGDPRQGTDVYVSFVSGGGVSRLPDDETISIDLYCTNRHLPAELRAGDITEPTDSSPPNTRFANLTKPTPTICPPMGRRLQWRLISHMSLNYVSLTDAARFKELLRIYDFHSDYDSQAAAAHQRMLEGILSVRSLFSQRMFHGAPLRGVRVEVDLNEDHFAGEGDAYLFARILDRFFGLYATLNGYSELTARFTRSGNVHSFPPRWGEQITPAEART
ncbi:MAG: hypothetical protein AMXMBFR83_22710 [Phycisphaerae bacterium]